MRQYEPIHDIEALMISEEYFAEAELADDLNCSTRTIKRWRAQRIGPPFVKIGKTILYRRDAVREWLRSLEQRQAQAETAENGAPDTPGWGTVELG